MHLYLFTGPSEEMQATVTEFVSQRPTHPGSDPGRVKMIPVVSHIGTQAGGCRRVCQVTKKNCAAVAGRDFSYSILK